MENNQRVLAYCKANELTQEDLMDISGGVNKLTYNGSSKTVTGRWPGTLDFETDQNWDN